MHGLLEGTALSEVLSLIKRMECDFTELEVLGRFPTSEECKNNGFQETVPLWFPTNGKAFNRKVNKALKALAKWMRDDYISKCIHLYFIEINVDQINMHLIPNKSYSSISLHPRMLSMLSPATPRHLPK